MASRLFQTGLNKEICLTSKDPKGEYITVTVDPVQIDPAVEYFLEFMHTGRPIVAAKKQSNWDKIPGYRYRHEKICWMAVKLCTGIYPVFNVQELFHKEYHRALCIYGWDQFEADLWDAVYVKMPERFSPYHKRSKRYSDYNPYFLRMFPYYISKALTKVKREFDRFDRIPGDLAVELNDDYLMREKEDTREDILDRLVTMSQTDNAIQNMLYYLTDMEREEHAGYTTFGRILGYKDLDKAGIKRIGCALQWDQ